MLADLDSAQSLSPNPLLKGPVVSLVYVILNPTWTLTTPSREHILLWPWRYRCEAISFILHKMQSWQIALKYNSLHDLESLWWVSVWTLFVHGLQEDNDTKYDPYKH